jgi:hypothetical protein
MRIEGEYVDGDGVRRDPDGLEIRKPTEKEKLIFDKQAEKVFKDTGMNADNMTVEQHMNYLDDVEKHKDDSLTDDEKKELSKCVNFTPEREVVARELMRRLALWSKTIGTTLSINKRDDIEEVIIRKAIYGHSNELIAKTKRMTVEDVIALEVEGIKRISDVKILE